MYIYIYIYIYITGFFPTRLHVLCVFQVFSNDLSLRYNIISVEPYGEITVDEGVPEAEATTGDSLKGWM